jgi:hypothetical protein
MGMHPVARVIKPQDKTLRSKQLAIYFNLIFTLII